jgi:hypothetical protein
VLAFKGIEALLHVVLWPSITGGWSRGRSRYVSSIFLIVLAYVGFRRERVSLLVGLD